MSEPDPTSSEACAAGAARESPRRWWSFREQRLAYGILLVLVVASYRWPVLPLPTDTAGAPKTGGRQTLDDLLASAREMPFGVQAAALVPLMVGSGLLLGYIVLRSCNVRVFPRCGLQEVPWDYWHLLRCLAAFAAFQRLGLAGLAWMQQAQRAVAWLAAVPGSLLQAGVTSVAMMGMCMFVVALVGGEGREALRLLGLREQRPLSRGAIGITAMLMSVPVLYVVGLLTVVLTGVVPERQPLLDSARQLSPGGFAALCVFAIVVAPMTEEILFRGVLYATLRRYLGPLHAICLSAAAFAVLHFHVPAMVPLFVVGFVVAYLYERTGSLVASIAAHAANNLHAMLIVFLVSRAGL